MYLHTKLVIINKLITDYLSWLERSFCMKRPTTTAKIIYSIAVLFFGLTSGFSLGIWVNSEGEGLLAFVFGMVLCILIIELVKIIISIAKL